MTPKTLRFIFDVPLRQWSTGKKEGKTKIQKFEYLKNEKRFLDEIKRIFHNYLRAIYIIWSFIPVFNIKNNISL